MRLKLHIVCGDCGRKNYPHFWRPRDFDHNRLIYQCVSCRAWMTFEAPNFFNTCWFLAWIIWIILFCLMENGIMRTGVQQRAVAILGPYPVGIIHIIMAVLVLDFLFALLIGTLGRFHTAPGKYDIIVPTKPLLILHGILRPKLHVLCGICGRKNFGVLGFHNYDYNHMMLKCANCGARIIMEAPSYRVLFMSVFFICLSAWSMWLMERVGLNKPVNKVVGPLEFSIWIVSLVLAWYCLASLFFTSCGSFRTIPGKEGIIVPIKPLSLLLHGKLRPKLHVACGICGRKNYPFFRKDFFRREIDPHDNRLTFKCASCGARMILEARPPTGMYMSSLLITMILVWPIWKLTWAILGRAAMLFMLFIGLMLCAVFHILNALLISSFCRFHAIADKDG